MKTLPSFESIRTTTAYGGFLKALYMAARPRVEEIEIPPVRVISVTGSQPPAAKQYQDAVAVLYGIGYSLKMGLKFGKLSKPAGYFDYNVGALETCWWSAGKEFDITNPKTLRWQAYLMVPAFVTKTLVNEARTLARTTHPEIPYAAAALSSIDEGRSVQMLHIGRYDEEKPTIDELQAYLAAHGLAVSGKHHEIYISDPRRTRPEKLRTVIRLAVRPASTQRRHAEVGK